VYGLLKGFGSIETKKANAMKQSSPSKPQTRNIPGGQITKQDVSSVTQLRNLPFVQKVKRKK
jgi:hypothetical protein